MTGLYWYQNDSFPNSIWNSTRVDFGCRFGEYLRRNVTWWVCELLTWAGIVCLKNSDGLNYWLFGCWYQDGWSMLMRNSKSLILTAVRFIGPIQTIVFTIANQFFRYALPSTSKSIVVAYLNTMELNKQFFKNYQYFFISIFVCKNDL